MASDSMIVALAGGVDAGDEALSHGVPNGVYWRVGQGDDGDGASFFLAFNGVAHSRVPLAHTRDRRRKRVFQPASHSRVVSRLEISFFI